MKAIILINIETGEIKQAVRDLRRIELLTEIQATFGPYDVIAIAEADDLDRIGRIVESEIQPIPGIQKTLTCLMVEGELPPADSFEEMTEMDEFSQLAKPADPAWKIKIENPFGIN